MQESKRQKQVGGLIQQEINSIFQKLSISFVDGAMISVSSVKVTPDLLEARIYLSIFKPNGGELTEAKDTLKKIEDRHWEIKKMLAASVRTQLRRIPELKFYLDDTLDHVFKMEKIFEQIKEEDQKEEKNDEESTKL